MTGVPVSQLSLSHNGATLDSNSDEALGARVMGGRVTVVVRGEGESVPIDGDSSEDASMGECAFSEEDDSTDDGGPTA